MTDHEFLSLADPMLASIETALIHAADAGTLDVEVSRSDAVLTLEFEDGSQIVIHRHLPNREIWVAARAGGFHYRPDAGQWHNTRDHSELLPSIAGMISAQAGTPFAF
jgi:CyaY protein